MKVLHAPMNFAMQPIVLIEELRRLGVDAHHVQYLPASGKHRFDFRFDKKYLLNNKQTRLDVHFTALKDALEYDYDIYHFWQRSLIFRADCSQMTGLDLPLIKARGKAKIVHRFTGFDLRLPSWDKEVNQYSCFNYGFTPPFDEDIQKEYLDFLGDYVDQFLVQDPELAQFMPEAKILPRALVMDEWEYTGVEPTDCPLVVHAPTNKGSKGSEFVFKAIEALKDEGLKFNFQTIQNMAHEKAQEVYKKADIIVDQILIGATGVLTLEAWALGKPCVVFLREDLFKPFYGGGALPVANATPDTITDVLRRLIKDYDWRQELSVKGRKLVEKYHDSGIVAQQCKEIYEDLMVKEPVTPKNMHDLDFFLRQLNDTNKVSIHKERAVNFLRRWIPDRILYAAKDFIANPSVHKVFKFLKKLRRYIYARMQERSTWIGGIGIIVSLAILVFNMPNSYVIGIALFMVGIILILTKDG